MPTTPINGLRYPAGSAAPNVPADLGNLAADTDSRLVGRFTTTTARDAAIASPVNGMIAAVGQIPTIYANGWTNLVTQTARGLSYTTGGITTNTIRSSLASASVTISSLDVALGRRIVAHVRGNFGVGGNSPFVGALIDGANLDPDEFEVQLEGKNSWYFAGAPLATSGTKSVSVFYRSHTSGSSVSAANVKLMVEVA